MTFFSVVDKKHETFSCVEKAFKERIEPLYGDQTNALKKIGEGVDRVCRVLFENEQPVGILVSKRDLSDEHIKVGLRASFEIKTLMLIDPEKNSGRDLGTKLVEKAEEIAKSINADGMVVTVSENRKDSLEFFKKKGFVVKQAFPEKYIPKVTEYLLHKQLWFPRASDYQSISLKYVYARQIIGRTKSIEGRIFTGVFARLRVGSRVRFFSDSNEVYCMITEIKAFQTFKKMLETVGYKKCLPESVSLEAAVQEYARIPGYPEKERVHGVVALELFVEPNPNEAFEREVNRERNLDLPEAKRKK
jgi:ASC-1-like (ASCH) protein/GNAT superfamily N-acetyltransferase